MGTLSEREEEKPKWQQRRGSDAIVFFADRAKISYELKQQEFDMLREQQVLERAKMEAMAKQQQQTQQPQTEMFKILQQQQQSQQQLVNTQMMMMQQQQEQSRAMMSLLEKLTNKWSMDLCQKSGFAAYFAALLIIPIK